MIRIILTENHIQEVTLIVQIGSALGYCPK